MSASPAMLRRAQRWAEPDAEEGVPGLSVAKVETRQGPIAFPLEKVLGLLPMRFCSPLPLAPKGLLGLLVFRGRVIPVLDLEALEPGLAREGAPAFALVLDAEPHEPFALALLEAPAEEELFSAAQGGSTELRQPATLWEAWHGAL